MVVWGGGKIKIACQALVSFVTSKIVLAACGTFLTFEPSFMAPVYLSATMSSLPCGKNVKCPTPVYIGRTQNFLLECTSFHLLKHSKDQSTNQSNIN